MDKSEILALFVILLVAVGAVVFMFYSDSIGQAIQPPSFPTMPAPQPAPPTPTPVPTRFTIEETTNRTKFPPAIAYYLTSGKLTTPGDAIKQVKIKPISPGEPKEGKIPIPPNVDKFEFNVIRGILDYVTNFDKFVEDPNCEHCWVRDINDVFNNGISSAQDRPSCGHYAELFVTLARLYGIPAKVVFTYQSVWAEEQKIKGCWNGETKGHVFARVYINGTWYTVDPQRGTFSDTDPKGNIIYPGETNIDKFWAEGRDSTDIMKIPDRICLESYRYNRAIPNLPLCKLETYVLPGLPVPVSFSRLEEVCKTISVVRFTPQCIMVLAKQSECKVPLSSQYKIQLG